ncbi:hypothetical protein J6590_074369 [Homalodisca vitripennis]|nr:hypothetical protein J6590_074369 [Homalodisca vitripennis]
MSEQIVFSQLHSGGNLLNHSYMRPVPRASGITSRKKTSPQQPEDQGGKREKKKRPKKSLRKRRWRINLLRETQQKAKSDERGTVIKGPRRTSAANLLVDHGESAGSKSRFIADFIAGAPEAQVMEEMIRVLQLNMRKNIIANYILHLFVSEPGFDILLTSLISLSISSGTLAKRVLYLVTSSGNGFNLDRWSGVPLRLSRSRYILKIAVRSGLHILNKGGSVLHLRSWTSLSVQLIGKTSLSPKAPCSDSISSKVLKFVVEVNSSLVLYMFNACLADGFFYSALKVTRLVLILKANAAMELLHFVLCECLTRRERRSGDFVTAAARFPIRQLWRSASS